LNADKIIVSNLLSYTQEGLGKILYARSTWEMNGRTFQVALPRMDLKGDAMSIVIKAMANEDMGGFMGWEYREPMHTCPFMKKAAVAVGQDGRISPCPPLLHSHACFFQGVERRNRECSFGSLKDQDLLDIYNDAQYSAFRKRVKVFDFSPCVSCASCELAEANEEDCTGNTFPTCGGCLWAQGLIQCP
jgi:MoaA/NifB/PqqE/SkfB family radical SAM enzyme